MRRSTPLPLSFVSACLGLADKLAIAFAMMKLLTKKPRDNGRSFLSWLRDQHQTERAIERFWKTVLVSALNEDLDQGVHSLCRAS